MCQETWKRLIPLSTECSYKREKQPNLLNTESKHFRDTHIQRVSRNRKIDKFFEHFKGFWCLTVSINMRKDQILWIQKCQETWKRPIPLSMECVYKREKRPNLLNTESKQFRNIQTLHHYIYIIIVIIVRLKERHSRSVFKSWDMRWSWWENLPIN